MSVFGGSGNINVNQIGGKDFAATSPGTTGDPAMPVQKANSIRTFTMVAGQRWTPWMGTAGFSYIGLIHDYNMSFGAGNPVVCVSVTPDGASGYNAPGGIGVIVVNDAGPLQSLYLPAINGAVAIVVPFEVMVFPYFRIDYGVNNPALNTIVTVCFKA